jgi:hypothetical protein
MNLKLLLIAVGAMFFQSTTAFPDSFGSKYDSQSGNWYHWHRNSSGETTVRGHNFSTGSAWTTTIEPDGDMRGNDSRGHYWRYNENTGSYFNFGTGETCIGKGAGRICSGGR